MLVVVGLYQLPGAVLGLFAQLPFVFSVKLAIAVEATLLSDVLRSGTLTGEGSGGGFPITAQSGCIR